MSDSVSCPICIDGELVSREGQLDQCGQTYLPTSVTTCTTCGWARYEPARTGAWHSTATALVGAADAPLRAA